MSAVPVSVPPLAWVIRAGRYGEREQWCLSESFAGGGWAEVPDLTAIASREELAGVVAEAYPEGAPGMRANATGQLWRMRSEIKVGDLVAMPLKHSAQIALGTVTGGYEYLQEEDQNKRHVLTVHWRRADLPRTVIKQDLLHSLGGAMTVFGISRHDGARRLRQLMESGSDPGSHASLPTPALSAPAQPAQSGADFAGEEEAETSFDLQRYAQDQIARWITENFAGHKLQDLVAAVLDAHGYVVDTPPKGPDGGVDVRAGRGPLGLDSPRIIGQVKSEPSPVGGPVVQQLQGAMSAHGADQGLLVALGGLTPQARQMLNHQRFSIRVWDSDALIEAVLEVYERLSESIRSQLPLRRIWSLAVEDDA